MLLFDLDGTLIDSNRLWQEIDEEFFARRGLVLTQEYTDYVTHHNYPDSAAYTRTRYHLPESPEQIMQIWSDMAEDAYLSRIGLKPGAGDLLRQQAARGEQIGLVTSCMPHLCRAVLRMCGVLDLFSSITTVTELPGCNKNTPDIWLLAAGKSGVPPYACTAFEDSLSGARGAKSAGMRTVGVYDPYFDSAWPRLQELCDRSVYSLEELVR